MSVYGKNMQKLYKHHGKIHHLSAARTTTKQLKNCCFVVVVDI